MRVAVTSPFLRWHRPQFYFRTTDVTGVISCQGTEMVIASGTTE
jgi:translation elongation factor EF-Tu-like GTPase